MKSHKPQPTSHTLTGSMSPFSINEHVPDFGKNFSAFGQRMLKLQQESVRFMGERLAENMKALQRLTACKKVPDLLAAQQTWFADAAHAYREEWSRYADLLAEPFKKDSTNRPDRDSSQSS